ncbi:Ankyrin repeat domain containing protein [Pandoravirus neocaledonia]|uniref:Ankyrin repeat domain containing protein n=1 Tax=Pandoravirus neocaledonia TaxID=2107708 RepID=A0A2U7UDL6_9VIRU|nr:Ankyrin repeat domain containing protein [Pandoravirus neocaledonia]AVK76420.1 Ankyrin repeat domain containing protein [Pandoravirus neocaledonia]
MEKRGQRRLATTADNNDNLVAASCPWETLPAEMRRKVIFDWTSDRDLGSCLLASGSFHVLTVHDLDARQYAHATIQGMCCAGDIKGLEYVLRHRPPRDAIDWPLCLYEAEALGHADTVAWILRHAPAPPHPALWDLLPTLFAGVGNDLMARRFFAFACAFVNTTDARDGARAEGASARMRAMLSHASDAEIEAALQKTRSPGVPCDLIVAWLRVAPPLPPREKPDPQRVTDIVRLDADRRWCRSVGDHEQADTLQNKLIDAFRPPIVDALVDDDRLEEAVSLIANKDTLARTPVPATSKTFMRVVKTCAARGRLPLVEIVMNSLCDPAAPSDLNPWAFKIVREAARGGHLSVLEYAHKRWPFVVYDESPLARAVAGGHLDCVRWLCTHGFACDKQVTWCPARCAKVSALTLALVARRRDMLNAMIDANGVTRAARDAFESAIAAGDMRSARTVRSMWPMVAAPVAIAEPLDCSPARALGKIFAIGL